MLVEKTESRPFLATVLAHLGLTIGECLEGGHGEVGETASCVEVHRLVGGEGEALQQAGQLLSAV